MQIQTPSLNLGYVQYLPYEERVVDTQYKDMLRKVMETGENVETIQGKTQGDRCKRLLNQSLRWNMANGFPLAVERDITSVLKGAMAELIAFIHGARTLSELDSYGVPRIYWERWTNEKICSTFGLEIGDIGDGAYGVQFGKPKCEGGEYSQIEAVIALARTMPFSRTLRVSNWRTVEALLNADPLKRRTTVAPCHGEHQLFPNEVTRELKFAYKQRAGDLGVGVAGNMVHAAGLGLMYAKVLGYKLVEVIHVIDDAHIYSRQFEKVQMLIDTPDGRLPTVTLEESIDNMFAFRKEHFHLSDYHPTGPKMPIDTPI
jgi:thymidylate synthase